jgi:hypothetical protein
MLNLIGIKCRNKIFISIFSEEDVWTNYSEHSHYDTCIYYFINGKQPEKSFHRYWCVINKEPEKVQIYKPQPNINGRYELIDNKLSDKLPRIIKEKDIEKDNSGYWLGEYANFQSLYKYFSDKQPDILVDVEFTYKTICELDEIKDYGIFKYNINHNSIWENKKEVNNKDLIYQLIDKLLFPEILLPSKSCKLNSKDSYDIVRAYVKENINSKYAEITSDYDFCFTVKKKITLSQVDSYTVDVNNSWFGKKKRKPKYEKRYVTSRLVEIFNMAPKIYNDYKVIDGFQGKNQEDLKNNIDDYCKQLIEFINEPLIDCPHCQGYGVILKENFGVEI